MVFEPGIGQRLSGPYMVAEPHELVGKLLLGAWLMYPHKWSREDGAAQVWRDDLHSACRERQLEVLVQVQARMDLTVALNAARVPPIEQLTASVAAIAAFRDRDQPISTEMRLTTRPPRHIL